MRCVASVDTTVGTLDDIRAARIPKSAVSEGDEVEFVVVGGVVFPREEAVVELVVDLRLVHGEGRGVVDPDDFFFRGCRGRCRCLGEVRGRRRGAWGRWCPGTRVRRRHPGGPKGSDTLVRRRACRGGHRGRRGRRTGRRMRRRASTALARRRPRRGRACRSRRGAGSCDSRRGPCRASRRLFPSRGRRRSPRSPSGPFCLAGTSPGRRTRAARARSTRRRSTSPGRRPPPWPPLSKSPGKERTTTTTTTPPPVASRDEEGSR
mmetsp:Transcript_32753/g.104396  ORF Transcript_32753/g.104396 Transcript_32753/m.104396 type:complete len:263 (+) Transcript_32753:107-895(+)